jgi:hypothetical protein
MTSPVPNYVLQVGRWSQYVPPKCMYPPAKLLGVTIQKTNCVVCDVLIYNAEVTNAHGHVASEPLVVTVLPLGGQCKNIS